MTEAVKKQMNELLETFCWGYCGEQACETCKVELMLKELVENAAGKKDAPEDDWMFDSFWEMYPKKQDKLKARKAWKKLAPDYELHQRILTAIDEQKKSDAWKRGFIPMPSTWLNGARWEDEPAAEPVRTTAKRMGGNASYKQTKISDEEFDAMFVDI